MDKKDAAILDHAAELARTVEHLLRLVIGRNTRWLPAAEHARQAIEKLDAPEREILMLREYEQLSYSDIAELLRIPVNTVRSRLFRSRLALKGHLESQAKNNSALRPSAGQPRAERRGMQ